MPTVFELIRKRLLSDVELWSRHGKMALDLQTARRTRWSTEFVGRCISNGRCFMPTDFEEYARNRLLLGYYRYEQPNSVMSSDNADRLASIHRRAVSYLNSGNQEFLVDSFNLLLLEWLRPNGSNAAFPELPRCAMHYLPQLLRAYVSTKKRDCLCQIGSGLLMEWIADGPSLPYGMIAHFESVDDGDHAV